MPSPRPPNAASHQRSLAALLLAALLTLVLPAADGRAQGATPPRVALVIGNGAYPQASIASAVADARAVVDLLHTNGFEVVTTENAARAEVEAAIAAFVQRLRAGATAVVYFAGHAVQFQDRNFLLGTDARIASETDLRRDGIDIDLILDPLIVMKPAASLVILDAARANPWQQAAAPRVRGLAGQLPIANIAVMYPTGPGQVVSDQNGRTFVTEFIRAAKAQAAPLDEIFRRTRAAVQQATRNQQTPWMSSPSSMMLASVREATTATPPRPADPLEANFWSTIKDSRNKADFEAYLDSYPNGAFAANARARLQQLGGAAMAKAAPAPAPAPVPAPAPPPTPAAKAAPPPVPPAPAPSVAVAPAPAVAAPRPTSAPATVTDCAQCPELVLVPAGSFEMGSREFFDFEGPVHQVTIGRDFYIGRREVTFEEWDACIADGGCAHKPDDRGLGRGQRPVTDLSWDDTRSYLAWLSRKTGKTYRLPSESEWEYAAKAGTTTSYPWGRTAEKDRANCAGCTSEPLRRAVNTGSYPPNAFGIFDMAGNAAEWVEDCWSDNYRGAPTDGSAVARPQCRERVLRGGSFNNDPRYLRSAARFKYDHDVRFYTNGFRVVRER